MQVNAKKSCRKRFCSLVKFKTGSLCSNLKKNFMAHYLLKITEDKTQKLTTVSLPYVKGLAEKIQKICSPYDIRTTFRSGLTLRKPLLWVKPPKEYYMIKNCVYSILCSCSKVSKGKTCCFLKVRLQEHRKTVVRVEIEKSGMADHIWKEKGNHLLLWDKVKIINREEHWKRRRL